jgi:4-methyl-5(b-hydroxyethyl)-thiazole monophosphate biosynthesis
MAPCSESAARVIVDRNLITSRGPGTALEFALALVGELYGKSKENEVAGPMVMPTYGPAKIIDSKVPA